MELGLYVRAVLAVRRGKPDDAIELMRESLKRIRELHDKFAFVYALVPLAAAAALKGDDRGRRGFWELATRSPNGPGRRLSSRAASKPLTP